MRTRYRVVLPLAAIGFLAGCNEVLGNTPGDLVDADGGAASDATVAPTLYDAATPPSAAHDAEPAPGPVSTVPDAASPPVADAGEGGTAAIPSCGIGEKLCSAACVAVDDPLFGCGLTVCVACALAHSTAACGASGCAVGSCDPGYADCDGDAANGCETDLSLASHCGTCNAKCGAAAPDCSPTSSGFACTTGCSGETPTLCGTQCVNLSTSLDNCGACSNSCPTPTNGLATCGSGHCGVACDTSFHLCSGACASDVSTSTCGSSCAPCAVEAHEVATCDGQSCGVACQGDYANCDDVASNGCEADLLTDGQNCGACNVSCGAGTCANGTCTAPPPPPVDAGPPDAGSAPPDAGMPVPDAGSPPPDAGSPTPDAGAPPADDAGPDFVDIDDAGSDFVEADDAAIVEEDG